MSREYCTEFGNDEEPIEQMLPRDQNQDVWLSFLETF